jgi:hypothetical protein
MRDTYHLNDRAFNEFESEMGHAAMSRVVKLTELYDVHTSGIQMTTTGVSVGVGALKLDA